MNCACRGSPTCRSLRPVARPRRQSTEGSTLGQSVGNGRICYPPRRSTRSLVSYRGKRSGRSEEHTSELQSLMRNSYAVFCLKKKKKQDQKTRHRELQE